MIGDSSWRGERSRYRAAVRAWHTTFGKTTFNGRYAHRMISSAPVNERCVVLNGCDNGIGIGFNDDHRIVVIYQNTPAMLAQTNDYLHIGDRIIGIDGIRLNGRPFPDVIDRSFSTHTLMVVHDTDALLYFPTRHCCGSLSEHCEQSTMCQMCGAVLLATEAVPSKCKKRTHGDSGVHGKHCCAQGSVSLPDADYSNFPRLRSWFLNDTIDGSEHFHLSRCLRTYARPINNALAMTSFTVKDSARQPGWNPSVVIQGRVSHLIGALHPTDDGKPPAFAQLMINDPTLNDSEVIKLRMTNLRLPPGTSTRDKEYCRTIVEYMSDMLWSHNPYVHDFALAAAECGDSPHMRLVIDPSARPAGSHARSYNDTVPSSSNFREVAVLLSDECDPTDRYNRSLVVRLRSNDTLTAVPYQHRSFDALHYVLLFPNGEDGFNSAMCISQLQHYAYKIQIRPNRPESRCLLRAGRLFAEYCCVAFAKIESSRLDWHKYNQKKIRSDLYNSLADHVHSGDNGRAGRQIVLGSSFLGGPRNQHQRFHDAMAIVRDRGKPSLFITFTCNPKWPEVVDSLLPGQQPYDRPDVLSRIFRDKFDSLMYDLTVDYVLGPVTAHLAVIEFQKRGLPHAHILLIFQSYSRLRNATHVDSIVSAEIPEVSPGLDEERTQQILRLQSCVCQHMLHNDCSDPTKPCPCHNRKGVCTKNFPHALSNETVWDDKEIYPRYRRRPFVGPAVVFKGRTLDNRWVAAYNPWLLLRYDAHINVEVCVGQHSVKYLYKYVMKGIKGGDRSMAQLSSDANDEVKNFQDMRSIGASEAVWRLLKFDLHSSAPSVVRLPVHLHNENAVYFQDGQESSTVAAGPPRTELTAWIEWVVHRTASEPRFHKLTYPQTPAYFRWDKPSKSWALRTFKLFHPNERPVGRMWFVSPTAGEQFYLSIMLCHTTADQLMEYIEERNLTVNDALTLGVNLLRFDHETFHDACLQCGHLQGIGEWVRIMDQACYTQMSHDIRFVFVTLLIHNDIADPSKLFEQFAQPMGDFGVNGPDSLLHKLLAKYPLTSLAKTAWQRLLALYAVRAELAQFGSCGLKIIPLLPAVSESEQALLDRMLGLSQYPSLIQQQYEFNPEVEWDKYQAAARNIADCASQAALLDFVVSRIDEQQSFAVFLDAPGGTGKTYCLNAILAYVRSQGKIALAVASTGIAALLLDGGTTVHSRFQLPLDVRDNTSCNITVQSQLGQLLRSVSLIVYDEAPMHHRHILECIDRTLRDINSSTDPFAGIPLILAGDFRQIAPIIPHASDAMIVASMLHQSNLWRIFTVMKLSENMRVLTLRSNGHSAQRLAYFSEWLLSVGDGQTNRFMSLNTTDERAHLQLTSVSQLQHFHSMQSDDDLQQMIDWTYPNLLRSMRDSLDERIAFLGPRMILAAHHSSVDAVNQIAIDMLPGDAVVCTSADSVEETYPIGADYLNTIEESGLPSHRLLLKRNTPVVLMRNLKPSQGLCNGTRLLVVKVIANAIVEAVIISGHPAFIGTLVAITRVKLFGNSTGQPFKWSRLQFPLKPAFAMTINKSQGQTLKRVALYLHNPCFAHGQFYVASSRVGDPDSLSYWLPADAQCLTANIVVPQILLSDA